MNDDCVIETVALTRRYGRKLALDHLDLRIPRGRIHAIVDVYAPPADFATPRGLPTTYLVAPDGKVAKHFLGPVTAAELDAAIAAAGGPAAG